MACLLALAAAACDGKLFGPRDVARPGAAAVDYGALLNSLVTFTVVALALFLLLGQDDVLQDRFRKEPGAADG